MKSLVDFNLKIIEKLEKKNCKSEGLNVSTNNVIIVEQENKDLGYVENQKKYLMKKLSV